ncbi:unnamed protein product [Umbelopsis sp. WA50703]
MAEHEGLVDALNSTFDSPIPTHELQVARDAIGQMGWDTNSVNQYLRTKRYWRSRPIIDNAMTQPRLSQERGVNVPIVTTARSVKTIARWRKPTYR